MSVSPAVATALAHIEAWSKQDYTTAQAMLAEDVHVTAGSVNPHLPYTDTTGVDAYMEGLRFFAGNLVPGSHQILAATGDDHYALVTVTVRTGDGPFAGAVIVGGRTYLINDDGKIQAEQVIFFGMASPA